MGLPSFDLNEKSQETISAQDYDIKINDKEYELRVGDFLLWNKDMPETQINKKIDNFLFRLFRSKTYPNSIILDFSPQVQSGSQNF